MLLALPGIAIARIATGASRSTGPCEQVLLARHHRNRATTGVFVAAVALGLATGAGTGRGTGTTAAAVVAYALARAGAAGPGGS
jgi:hypothetical protein